MKIKKNAMPLLFPMPVQMIATYNEDNTTNIMNAAWGGILDNDIIVLSLSETHKTSTNIKNRNAFTLSLATKKYVNECDYVGIISGNVNPNKFETINFHATKSKTVDAPIIDELPLCLECEVIKISNDELGFLVYARIVDVLVDDSVISNGQIDINKLDAFMYSQLDNCYYSVGENIGKAFNLGKKYLKK